MSRKRLFFENFIIYGIGGGLSKVIPFIMLPILTRLYPDSGFIGINEMFTVGLTFVASVTGFGLYDAMFRFLFEDTSKEKQTIICSTCLKFELFVDTIALLAIILMRKWISVLLFERDDLQSLVVILAFCVVATNVYSILSAPIRMQNKRKTYLAINIVSSIITYGITLLFVLHEDYYIAQPLGTVASLIVALTICFLICKQWFNINKADKEILKNLLVFSLPLVPNVILFWVFNSVDRLMIKSMMDVQAVGIYSVGGKIGHISNLIYTAFAGGWQYFVFSTMKDGDQKELTRRLYEYLSAVTYLSTIMITCISIPMFKILFKEEYWGGAYVVPYLFMAPLMLMQYQVITDQFLVIKKTLFSLIISVIGVALNVGMNWIGITFFGYEAAAVATLISYFVMVISSAMILKKYGYALLTIRYIIISFITMTFICLWRVFMASSIILSIFLAIPVCLIIVLCFRTEVKTVLLRKKTRV